MHWRREKYLVPSEIPNFGHPRQGLVRKPITLSWFGILHNGWLYYSGVERLANAVGMLSVS
jgi:hypothetical protein